MQQTLVFPDHFPCDFYRGVAHGVVVLGVDGKWHTVPRPDLESALFSSVADPQQAVRTLLAAGSYPASDTHPYETEAPPESDVPAPDGNSYGLGPVAADGMSVTHFRKSSGNGSAFGEPVAIVAGRQCNVELEGMALVHHEAVYAYSFAIDAGVKGKFDDEHKGYRGALGCARRIHIGRKPLPDVELRLEIRGGDLPFKATRSLGDYLRDRNPAVLIPLFLKSEAARELGKSRGVGILLGAACNTAKGNDVFRLSAGMKIAGFVNDVLVLSHEIEERTL